MGKQVNSANTSNRRNAVTDLMKFVFAGMIVLYHTRNYMTKFVVFPGGYIAVDFFFIVSGYFLAASAAKRKRLSPDGSGGILSDTARYIGRRLSRIYPELIVATIIALAARTVVLGFTPRETWELFLKAYGEWTLLQQLGLGEKIIIGGVWYVSAMMIASCILYPMARTGGRRFNLFIAPLIFIILFILTWNYMTNIQVPDDKMYGLVQEGLVRGTMDMALGCFVFGLRTLLADAEPSKPVRWLLTAAEVGLYLGIIYYYSHGKHYNHKDWYTIILLGIAILITQSNFSYTKDVIKGRFFEYLGALSFDLYLGHRFWALLIKRMEWSDADGDLYKTGVYFVLAAVTTFAIMYGGKLLSWCFSRIYGSMRKESAPAKLP